MEQIRTCASTNSQACTSKKASKETENAQRGKIRCESASEAKHGADRDHNPIGSHPAHSLADRSTDHGREGQTQNVGRQWEDGNGFRYPEVSYDIWDGGGIYGTAEGPDE